MTLMKQLYTKLLDLNQQNLLIDEVIGVYENLNTNLSSPLVSASKIFPAIANMIKDAKSEVLVSLYKFQEESYGGQMILDAIEFLKKRADSEQKKISLKIIINQKKGLASLISGGGNGITIDYTKLIGLNSEYFNIEIARYQHHSFDSTHEKYVVVDGKKSAILTGDPSIKNTKHENTTWIELGTIISSEPFSQKLRLHFSKLWHSPQIVTPHSSKSNIEISSQQKLSIEKTNNNINVILLAKAQTTQVETSHYSPYKIALIDMLNAAQKSVDIMVNNINDKDIIHAIAGCANRGVKINFVLGRYHGDSAEKLPFAGGRNRSSIQYLISKVNQDMRHHLDIRWATNHTGNLVQNMEYRTVHAKCVIVDNRYVLTGSSLMDKQSQRSRETDILFESKTKALEYKNIAFTPVFEFGRSVNIKAEGTRYEIKQQLKDIKSKDALKKLVKEYIILREYESNYLGPRKFWSPERHSRSKKIHAAQSLFEAIDAHHRIDNEDILHELQEGLLGEIYKKYNQIINEKSILSDFRLKCKK